MDRVSKTEATVCNPATHMPGPSYCSALVRHHQFPTALCTGTRYETDPDHACYILNCQSVGCARDSTKLRVSSTLLEIVEELVVAKSVLFCVFAVSWVC